jgi:hypothetical protein
MGWPRKHVFGPAIDLSPEEIAPEVEHRSRIERSLAAVGQSLDIFRADEIRIEQEIADREAAHRERIAELTEELRQARICIEGFTANDRILVAGAKPPEAPVERLVPRAVKSRAAS